MAKYKKRADGRYCTSIMLNIDGEKKKKYVYGKTIKDVDDKIAELRAASNKGAVFDDREITVAQWAKTWLETYKQDVEYNTYYMYQNAVEKHIIPTLQAIRLSQVKPSTLKGILNGLTKCGKERTAEVVKVTMQQIFDAALQEHYIQFNPATGLKLPKHKKPEKRALTKEEIKTLQSADLTIKQRAFVYVLLYAGLRRGEALALSKNDIDLDNNLIRIRRNLIYKGNDAELKSTPKTDAGVRDVPIPNELAEVLRQYLKTINSIVFPMQSKDDYMSQSAYVKFWKTLIKHSGLSNEVTAHMMRHTYATQLYYKNIDIKTAQYLLGHSNITVTLNIYTHLQQLDNNKLVGNLNNLYDEN